ncbi:hypothetical protein ACGFS9_25225 [Streptomyces sp. NPDC048566]|uniref:hypothetical protein n=1 Tax=Streptomyces sp. NPDC048566 TaxID=3365569 RepID=UPI00372129B9
MAGIYRLRLGKYGDLVERALDLDRFAQKLEVISNESFIRFFSIRHQGWRILVAVSDDLNQPIAATAVRGVGGDPASTTVGAVGFISTDQARVLCNRLVEDGWDAANVAVETLSNPTPADIPFWLATPQTLARQYSSRVKDSSESSDGASVNLIRFADAMVECRDPSKYICIFHLFDDYGWQSTVAVSEDLTQPLGVVAIERSTR